MTTALSSNSVHSKLSSQKWKNTWGEAYAPQTHPLKAVKLLVAQKEMDFTI